MKILRMLLTSFFPSLLIILLLILWLIFTFNKAEEDKISRGDVGEGLALSIGVREAVKSFYEKQNIFPNNNFEVGLPESQNIVGNPDNIIRVEGIEIVPNGKILIHYFDSKTKSKLQILLTAKIENKKIIWDCQDNLEAKDHFDQKHLPASCRA